MSNYAKVRVSIEFLTEILRGEFGTGYKIETDSPKDLEVIGLSHIDLNFPPHTLYIICASSTFPENIEGADIPEIPPFTYTIKKGKL